MNRKIRLQNFLVIIASVLLLSGMLIIPSTLASPEEQAVLVRAPLNPAFLEHLEKLEDGDLRILSGGGYPLGYAPPPVDRSHLWEPPAEDDVEILSLPVSYDLRAEGRLTPVRDQDPYGSCWAFATYGSLESYLMAVKAYNFSENNLMLLHGFDLGPDDGGNELISIAYLARWSGPVNEEDDPYGANDATEGLSPVKHVQNVEVIPDHRNMIKRKIKNDGALYTAMFWEDDPYASVLTANQPELRQSEFYDTTNHAYYYYKDTDDINHDVVIVGWDDTYDRKKFSNAPPGDGAWIVRNSWGSDWGDDGYFYLSYYDTYAGSGTVAFHNAESTSNYNRIYQHDQLGLIGDLGYGSEAAYAANIFTAAESEKLAAVSTYAVSQNMSYEIRIYTGVNSGLPTSGELQLTQEGSFTNGGYYTIPLNSAVTISAGEKFSVVIRYTTSGYGFPVPAEHALDGYSSSASASPGESFISFNGTDWEDISQTNGANVCIKAFTEGVIEVQRDFSVGLYDSSDGVFHLKGVAPYRFGPTGSSWLPVAGDWNRDGNFAAGLYDPSDGVFHLEGISPYRFGPRNSSWLSVAGDWNRDGNFGAGLYDPSDGVFHLAGISPYRFGPRNSDWIPLSGDWNGDGTYSTGLYDPSDGVFHLNGVTPFRFGPTGSSWQPVAGDWNGNGTCDVGLYDPSDGVFHLEGIPPYRFGPRSSTWIALAGIW